MEYYTSDSSSDSEREHKTIEYGKLNLQSSEVEDHFLSIWKTKRRYDDIETIHLNNNVMNYLPQIINKFTNLKIIDLSYNRLISLPEALIQCQHLTTLIAKNNLITNKGIPKSLVPTGNDNKSGGVSLIRELNLSGNKLKYFPEQILELRQLKYLYLNANEIRTISRDVWKLNG